MLFHTTKAKKILEELIINMGAEFFVNLKKCHLCY